MSTKSRTSLTLSPEALEIAKHRSRALGYDSVSEYIQFLILEDEKQKRRHIVTRDASGVSYNADADHLRLKAPKFSVTDPVPTATQMEILELLKSAEAQNTRQHIEEMIRLAGAKKVRDLRTMLDRMADDSTILNEPTEEYQAKKRES